MITQERPAAAEPVPGLAVAAPRRTRGSPLRAPYWLMAPSLALLAIVVFVPMAAASYSSAGMVCSAARVMM